MDVVDTGHLGLVQGRYWNWLRLSALQALGARDSPHLHSIREPQQRPDAFRGMRGWDSRLCHPHTDLRQFIPPVPDLDCAVPLWHLKGS